VQRQLCTPTELALIAAHAPTAAELAERWDGTVQAEFVALVNPILAAYRDRAGADHPDEVPVPDPAERVSVHFRDCKLLQVVFSRSLTLGEKVRQLRALHADVASAARVHKSRRSGAIAASNNRKRAHGKASRLSGEYGHTAQGVPKRSPHVSLGRQSPAPAAAGDISSYVRRSITQRSNELKVKRD